MFGGKKIIHKIVVSYFWKYIKSIDVLSQKLGKVYWISPREYPQNWHSDYVIIIQWRYFLRHKWHYLSSREHIGNIDDSLMLSSLTSMMHQFYTEHRKHWWIFDVTLVFHLCFQCFSTLKPAMLHLLNINDSSIKYWWVINERTMNRRRGKN